MASYSQYDEEAWIQRYFSPPTHAEPTRGTWCFLDVGAHDGVSASNTRRLAEQGWGGTLVEPSPEAFLRLMELYRDRPRVDLVNAGLVAYESRLLPFYDAGGLFVGTFDKGHRDAWEGKQHVHYRPIHVAGVTFPDLLLSLPGPYHFVSIDAEGTNLQLLESFFYANRILGGPSPAERCDTHLLCVEHDGREKEMEQLANDNGFERYHRTEANLLLKRII